MILRQATIKEKRDFYEIIKSQEGWIHNWEEEGLMCVLEKDGMIIGFVREVNPIYVKEDISVLGNVWIHEPFRGEKLGLKLVQYLIDNINRKVIWLDCRPSLEHYYAKLGFVKTDDMPEGFLNEEEKTRLIVMKLNK